MASNALAAGAVLRTVSRVRLDWSDPIHWDATVMADCRVCITPTHSRDAQGRPIHQSCAADLAAEQFGRRYAEFVDERYAAALTQQDQHTEATR